MRGLLGSPPGPARHWWSTATPCGTPFCKQGLTYRSGPNSLGPRGPAASGDGPPGLHAGISQAIFIISFRPLKQGPPAASHRAVTSASSGPVQDTERSAGCRPTSKWHSYYPGRLPPRAPTQAGWWERRPAAGPLRPPFSFPLQKTGQGEGTGSETLAPWLIQLIFTACCGPGPEGRACLRKAKQS